MHFCHQLIRNVSAKLMTQCLIGKEHVYIWIDGRSGFYAVTVSILHKCYYSIDTHSISNKEMIISVDLQISLSHDELCPPKKIMKIRLRGNCVSLAYHWNVCQVHFCHQVYQKRQSQINEEMHDRTGAYLHLDCWENLFLCNVCPYFA